jgi:eukaryotic-like serine/threonine-protein kinase
LHEANLKQIESKLGPAHPNTLTSRSNLALAYRAAGRTAEAITLLEATLKIRESKLGPAHPDTLASVHTHSQLGGALLGQRLYAEAEPLVVAGYEGMKERQAKIAAVDRSRLREAAERVVRLYEDWGKAEQATAWKAKLRPPDLPADVFARP